VEAQAKQSTKASRLVDATGGEVGGKKEEGREGDREGGVESVGSESQNTNSTSLSFAQLLNADIDLNKESSEKSDAARVPLGNSNRNVNKQNQGPASPLANPALHSTKLLYRDLLKAKKELDDEDISVTTELTTSTDRREAARVVTHSLR
jgi:hypothetical protein